MRTPRFLPTALWLAGAASLAAGDFEKVVWPVLEQHCTSCHSEKKHKGDLNLERFATPEAALKHPRIWQQVVEQIEDGEMPPDDEPPLTAEEKTNLLAGVRGMLREAALANAGDPGPVVLRRLSNAEYEWTLRDLTGISGLDPAREFPVDGAAGEGFTNAGAALVMSPALVAKYLEAAKEVAAHAVLLPDGITFSPNTTRRDWTEERLAAIREIYARYSVPGDGMALNLQGLRFDTLDGGVLPLEKYLAATLEEKDALAAGEVAAVAKRHSLSPKYLGLLWAALNETNASYPLEGIRGLWRAAKPGDAAALAATVKGWQASLWRFHTTGQIGKRNGPKSWQEAVTPLATERELRVKLPAAVNGDVTLSLVARNADDGSEGDAIQWVKPRLLRGKLPSIPVQQAELLDERLAHLMDREVARTVAYLDAIAAAKQGDEGAGTSGLNPALLSKWSVLAELGRSETPEIHGLFTEKISDIAGHPLLRGWGSAQTPSMTVNGSAETVKFSTLTVPGRSVLVHPSPDREAAIVWRSPIAGKIRIAGEVADADGNCGNGVAWRVDRIGRNGRRGIAAGVMDNGSGESFAPAEEFAVEAGDLIAFGINPRDGQNACDTTQVALAITESSGGGAWDLAKEVIDRVHEGNPLADLGGRPAVWHFCGTPLVAAKESAVPAGSLLAKWRDAVTAGGTGAELKAAAEAVQNLLTRSPDGLAEADATLRARLLEPDGPLAWGMIAMEDVATSDIGMAAPAKMEFRIPARLAAGAEFVVTARLDPEQGREGSVVADVVLTDASGLRKAVGEMPVLAAGAGAERAAEGFNAFHAIFPAALCYTKIVPVDEVVTLRLFYREDEVLKRLVLDDEEIAQLDRLWAELDFVSLAPLRLVDSFEQLAEYITQGGNPDEIEPFRKPVEEGAVRFRAALAAAEPRQLDAVIRFAQRAWRRPLSEAETKGLRSLYAKLRGEDLEHEEALRLTLARVLTAPAFLYKIESPAPGEKAEPVNDRELATRLSYFLWSSVPDEQLQAVAATGRLKDPQMLADQASRMMSGPRVRRLAIEFGTQWLHVRGLDQLDEKSESVFPEFVPIRGDLNEEAIRFFTDLFQRNGSVLDLLEADHVFVNGRLAKYYGIPGVEGEEWQRVDGARALGRGGILGLGATLAKQSGASRTSPILRGAWVCETLLGEHLPPPPKDVPILPEQPPANLSERELTEMHAKDPACARCHAGIDPYGFALEHYDAIGRFRTVDLTKKPVNAAARTEDGKEFTGIDGLRDYLANERRDDFVRQFCRKLLGYALGRGVLISDEPLLEEMQAALAADGYRVGIAIDKIVLSPQFREIRGKDHPADH